MSKTKNKTPTAPVNFVKHFRAVVNKFREDDRLTCFHISMYIALFDCWNQSRFASPIRIFRDDLMQVSKIGSNNKYGSCLRDLHEWGYIHYMPTATSLRPSQVELYRFDAETGVNSGESTYAQNQHDVNTTRTGADMGDESPPGKNDTRRQHDERPLYINILNNINKLEREHTRAKKNGNDIFITSPPVHPDSGLGISNEPDEKKVTRGGGAGGPVPAAQLAGEDTAVPVSINEVQEFFIQQHSTLHEALKFFNYYTSNGWKVGGRTAMKNWRAAASKWILNDLHTPNQKKTHASNFHVSTDKNYGEPL